MAGVTIITTGNLAEINYGDYYVNSGTPYASTEVRAEKGCVYLSDVDELWKDSADVYLRLKGRSAWRMGTTQTATNFVVSEINGVTPADPEHLYQLIKALL